MIRVLLFFTSALILSACAKQEVIVTQRVEVPVRCDAQMPRKQNIHFSGEKLLPNGQPTKEYLEYTGKKMKATKLYIIELEHTLNFCINGINK